jgi:hypothetical protein
LECADNDAVEVREKTLKDGTVVRGLVAPDPVRDSLRVKTRLQLAGLWDRERYGEGQRGRGGQTVKVVVVNPVGSGAGESQVGVSIEQGD